MAPEENTQPVKVMLLDDERFLLDMYRISFEKSGYEVTIFHDADDAFKDLRAGYEPDVILFDITMPDGKSGYEFIETVGREHLGKGSLKVALTNEGQDGELARLAELGADGHIAKANFLPAQIVTAVAQMLQARPH